MGDEREFTHLLCGKRHRRGPGADDEVIARLAGRQYGIASRRQLLDLGVSARAIDHRLDVGRLHSVLRGVYAPGHAALSFHGRVTAALLGAVGRADDLTDPIAHGVAASHLTAAALWGLREAHSGPVHVSTRRRHRRQRNLIAHRSSLARDEIALLDGLLVTTIPRTLLDLAAVMRAPALRRLVKAAEFDEHVTIADLVATLERHPTRRGRATLREALGKAVLGVGRSRSELEDRFLEFCRRRGLPLPRTNQRVEVEGRSFEVDCIWPAERVIVEMDGFAAHGGRLAFDDDRARDRALASAGWLVLRITWTHLHDQADTLASELQATLAAREGNLFHAGGG